MSGSSYWPRSAVYVHGTAPRARIHATATEVSRPPEKAMPTRSPTGREVRTLLTLFSSLLLGLLGLVQTGRAQPSASCRPARATSRSTSARPPDGARLMVSTV